MTDVHGVLGDAVRRSVPPFDEAHDRADDEENEQEEDDLGQE